MMNREQLEQKILVCQELATKAALRGLCHVSQNLAPRHDSFSVSVYHVDSTFDSQIFHAVFFLDDLSDSEVFELESVIAFFQGLLDSGRVMVQASEPHDEPEEQPADRLTPEAAAENVRLASEWRSEAGFTQSHFCGYVIVCAGQVTGWIGQLRDANHWEPGVIAVGVFGSQYKAVGGDPYNGAESWQLVSTTQGLKGAAA